MKKHDLILLSIVFILGYINDVHNLGRTFFVYIYILVSFGVMCVYLWNKFIEHKVITKIQVIVLTISIMALSVFIILAIINEENSIGVGLIIALVLSVILSEVIVFMFHLSIKDVVKNQLISKNEKIGVLVFTIIYIVMHQAVIPNNYYVPILSIVVAFILVVMLIGLIIFIVNKFFNKNKDKLLFGVILLILIVQSMSIDLRMFILLPIQLILISLMVVDISKCSELNCND